MERYSRIDKIRNINENVRTLGLRYYKPNYYPEIPFDASDLYVVTEFGDRFEALADQFYSDTTLYWIIATANPNKVSLGSLFIDEGSQIRIPLNINAIIDSYNELNNV